MARKEREANQEKAKAVQKTQEEKGENAKIVEKPQSKPEPKSET